MACKPTGCPVYISDSCIHLNAMADDLDKDTITRDKTKGFLKQLSLALYLIQK
jgi:hypothetical protein